MKPRENLSKGDKVCIYPNEPNMECMELIKLLLEAARNRSVRINLVMYVTWKLGI